MERKIGTATTANGTCEVWWEQTSGTKGHPRLRGSWLTEREERAIVSDWLLGVRAARFHVADVDVRRLMCEALGIPALEDTRRYVVRLANGAYCRTYTDPVCAERKAWQVRGTVETVE